MRIPKQFTLLGQRIIVVFDNELCAKKGWLGCADFDHNRIVLADQILGESKRKKEKVWKKLPKEKVEQTFFHELTHFMLHFMNEAKLRDDEKFIDLLGTIQYEFSKSKE